MTKTFEISGVKIRTASRAAYVIVAEHRKSYEIVDGDAVVELHPPCIIGYAYSLEAAEKRKIRGPGRKTIVDIRGDGPAVVLPPKGVAR
jgi:hypothetical protein